MDQNEAFGRQNFAAAIARAATAVAADPGAADIIRKAREDNARQAREALMREDELLQRLGCEDLYDLDRKLSTLVTVGFPYRHELGGAVYRSLKTDRLGRTSPTIRADRHAIERWLAAFDEIARTMGYTKKVR